jgi:hypothetical protein
MCSTRTRSRARCAPRPETVIHQLTDLPREFDESAIRRVLRATTPASASEGTRNLIAAARAAGAALDRSEASPLVCARGEPASRNRSAQSGRTPRGRSTIKGTADMEQQVLAAPADGVILRYGLLYGPSHLARRGVTQNLRCTSMPRRTGVCSHHTRGAAGIYNVADDDGAVLDRQGARRARLRFGVPFAVKLRRVRTFFAKAGRCCGQGVTFWH